MRLRDDHGRLWRLALAIGTVFALGFFGHRIADPAASLPDVAYRSARLFLLNLDVPPRTDVPWTLWLAAVAAPLLTIGGVATLLSERLDEGWTRMTARRHVVVFGVGTFASSLARSAAGERRRVVVVHDGTNPGAIASLRRAGVRTVRGELGDDQSARSARVDRAREVFVATDDERTNATILRHVAAGSESKDVFVRLDDLDRARLVDRARLARVTPFSLPVLAACRALEDARGDTLLVVGEGAFAGALITEAARRKRDGEGFTRVILAGRGATLDLAARRARLEHAVPGLALDAFDIDGALTLEGPFGRYLSGWGRIDHAIVGCDGAEGVAAFAFALSEHLGGNSVVTLLTSRADSFDDHVTNATTADAHRATVTVVNVTERVTLNDVRSEAISGRLGENAEIVQEFGLTPVTQDFVSFTHAELALADAIGIHDVRALETARIEFDWTAPEALHAIGEWLLERHPEADPAFAVWCEIARRATDPVALGQTATRLVKEIPPSDARERTLRLLALRRATLGGGVPPTASLVDGRYTAPVVMVAGGSGSMSPHESGDLARLLRFAVADGSFAGTLVSGGTHPGVGGVVGEVASDAGLRAVGFVQEHVAGDELHRGYDEHVRTGATWSIDQALGAWEQIVAARVATDPNAGLRPDLGDVRLLACSGGRITEQEVLLARALGVEVGWLALGRNEVPLNEILLGGDVGVMSLVVDRATVRAFLRPTRWPDAATREHLARALHKGYIEAHRSRKPAGDPALRSWAQLSQGLRASNLAVIDDVPSKLQAIGCELGQADHGRLPLGTVDAPSELLLRLAELEHGRYNAERLRAGWEVGARNPSLQITPYLTPWDELDYEARLWDLEIVVGVFDALAAHGWGVCRPRAAAELIPPPHVGDRALRRT